MTRGASSALSRIDDFAKALKSLFIDRMEQNEEIFARFMNDEAFCRQVEEMLRHQVYDKIRSPKAEPAEAGR